MCVPATRVCREGETENGGREGGRENVTEVLACGESGSRSRAPRNSGDRHCNFPG